MDSSVKQKTRKLDAMVVHNSLVKQKTCKDRSQLTAVDESLVVPGRAAADSAKENGIDNNPFGTQSLLASIQNLSADTSAADIGSPKMPPAAAGHDDMHLTLPAEISADTGSPTMPPVVANRHWDRFMSIASRILSMDPPFENPTNLVDADIERDVELLKLLYKDILEVIVTNQAEDVLAQLSNVDVDSDEAITPPSKPKGSGDEDTCPPAPMKTTRKVRDIDKELCRKLF